MGSRMQTTFPASPEHYYAEPDSFEQGARNRREWRERGLDRQLLLPFAAPAAQEAVHADAA